MKGAVVLLFIPIVLIEVGLMIWALLDCTRREYVTGGNKVIWILIIVLVSLIGPLVYFFAGRRDGPEEKPLLK